jgi:TRAP transporter TAXI family solute receptor
LAIFEHLALLSRGSRLRLAALVLALIAVVVWATFHFTSPGPTRRIVLASGTDGGVYHRFAHRYVELLAREGVKVTERTTSGADENLKLMLDPKSGVDVAFMQGGLAHSPETDGLVMLASLYYEPMWVFYRYRSTLPELRDLLGKRVAVGIPGSGTRVLALRLLELNGVVDEHGIGRENTDIRSIGGDDALKALKTDNVDAALFVGGAETPVIQQALREPGIQLMSLKRADAYPRHFPYISKLSLPQGAIDLASNVPDRDVAMIGTKAMLIAHEGLHPALVNLFLDAAREIHDEQGYFEAAGEFPDITALDFRVSPDADQHKRFGPSLLYRYFPFWIAAILERAIIVLLPLVVIIVPVMNLLPQFLRWRTRSRIFRWYGELALLERAIHTRKGVLPIDTWMSDLDRIEKGVERIRVPARFASEVYTLREHVDLVRRAVLAKAAAPRQAAA